MATSRTPPSLTSPTTFSSACHIAPVWCRTPQQYTTSYSPIEDRYSVSSTEPRSMVHRGSFGKYRRRSSPVQATDCGSQSNEWPSAPARRAAKLTYRDFLPSIHKQSAREFPTKPKISVIRIFASRPSSPIGQSNWMRSLREISSKS